MSGDVPDSPSPKGSQGERNSLQLSESPFRGVGPSAIGGPQAPEEFPQGKLMAPGATQPGWTGPSRPSSRQSRSSSAGTRKGSRCAKLAGLRALLQSEMKSLTEQTAKELTAMEKRFDTQCQLVQVQMSDMINLLDDSDSGEEERLSGEEEAAQDQGKGKQPAIPRPPVVVQEVVDSEDHAKPKPVLTLPPFSQAELDALKAARHAMSMPRQPFESEDDFEQRKVDARRQIYRIRYPNREPTPTEEVEPVWYNDTAAVDSNQKRSPPRTSGPGYTHIEYTADDARSRYNGVERSSDIPQDAQPAPPKDAPPHMCIPRDNRPAMTQPTSTTDGARRSRPNGAPSSPITGELEREVHFQYGTGESISSRWMEPEYDMFGTYSYLQDGNPKHNKGLSAYLTKVGKEDPMGPSLRKCQTMMDSMVSHESKGDIPAYIRVAKPLMPTPWEGVDDLYAFEEWLQRLLSYFQTLKITGPSMDSDRLRLLGSAIKGDAYTWGSCAPAQDPLERSPRGYCAPAQDPLERVCMYDTPMYPHSVHTWAPRGSCAPARDPLERRTHMGSKGILRTRARSPGKVHTVPRGARDPLQSICMYDTSMYPHSIRTWGLRGSCAPARDPLERSPRGSRARARDPLKHMFLKVTYCLRYCAHHVTGDPTLPRKIPLEEYCVS
ncbi:uncharacterized protein C8Q71DRAFT_727602 [Rhodofomes roseus]|uniref:Uncharacterized protein n=1 Tax=Rhodofomes roseus TaxID=34475 RepID=A0ABQ8K1P0_9APHY|nr:uncharacterized protein C8Q71DRAFT_727602 [Rhodofomes roseus]KAH9830376.1 hypothetical protein C8Q71DRAFT_727602 [Rhodofomes roseus]